ncbi:hypothetical protein CEXT_689461 [Caerostris extrusa]|uniref:Uncharacterized protein n=1 Tax=Caerostris extrusa TaxID=172846 RepID=A0AAV4RQ67_CAEEX|nr:hypothetical protein CEXT_689461 [Caerostris extrusa]
MDSHYAPLREPQFKQKSIEYGFPQLSLSTLSSSTSSLQRVCAWTISRWSASLDNPSISRGTFQWLKSFLFLSSPNLIRLSLS